MNFPHSGSQDVNLGLRLQIPYVFHFVEERGEAGAYRPTPFHARGGLLNALGEPLALTQRAAWRGICLTELLLGCRVMGSAHRKQKTWLSPLSFFLLSLHKRVNFSKIWASPEEMHTPAFAFAFLRCLVQEKMGPEAHERGHMSLSPWLLPVPWESPALPGPWDRLGGTRDGGLEAYGLLPLFVEAPILQGPALYALPSPESPRQPGTHTAWEQDPPWSG